MANRIKGITVEIGGDTTKLQNALKGVKEEMIRVEELNRARDEMKKEGKIKPVSQKMFRVV